MSDFNSSFLRVEKLIRPDLIDFSGYSAHTSMDTLERTDVSVKNIIKLDANENPYGCSPRVSQALAGYSYLNIYPDNGQTKLREQLEVYTGIDAHHIVAGGGSNQLIDLVLRLFVGAGDEVIVPPRTFIATASAVVMCGARPVFADVDPDSQNITATSIRQQITPQTKAIIVVHLAGWSCDMDPIMALARECGLKVIEDCAQAHGARYKGRPVGSIGDVAAFSFCQDKIMTTGGEGGMLLTSDESIWRYAWEYKDHGKSYDALYRRERPNGEVFRWVHESFGTNWRMTEMQAVLGRIQLNKLNGWVARRQENAALLTERLSQHRVFRIPMPSKEFEHSFYKYYVMDILSVIT